MLSQSLPIKGARFFEFTFKISSSPPAKAPAIIKVPASILSGIGLNSVPFNLLTPSITISFSPAPFIFAPALFKKFAKSTISGSLAAFRITVFPFINTHDKIIFSVAPTDGKSKYTSPPFNLSPAHHISPPISFISAPKFFNELICISIGLSPISQPPG